MLKWPREYEIRARVDDVRTANLQDRHYQTVGAKSVLERAWSPRCGSCSARLCGGPGMVASAGLGALHALLSPSRNVRRGDLRALTADWESDSEALAQRFREYDRRALLPATPSKAEPLLQSAQDQQHQRLA